MSVSQDPIAPGDDSPPVYRVESGLWRYRSSMLGACVRELVAYRLGLDHEGLDAASKKRMREGHIHEPHILYEVEQQLGEPVVLRQARVGVNVLGRAEVSGSMDGVILTLQDNQIVRVRIVDGKAVGRDHIDSYLEQGVWATPRYAWQFSAYWWGVQETLGLKVDGAILAVKNRDNGDVHPIEIQNVPYTLEEVRSRVALVEGMAARAAMSGTENGRPCFLPQCDAWSPWCRFRHLHERSERSEEFTVIPELEPTVREYVEVGEKMKKLEQRHGALRDHIKDATRDLGRVRTGIWQIGWTRPKKNQFNFAKFAAEYPELARQYTTLPPRKPHPRVTVASEKNREE